MVRSNSSSLIQLIQRFQSFDTFNFKSDLDRYFAQEIVEQAQQNNSLAELPIKTLGFLGVYGVLPDSDLDTVITYLKQHDYALKDFIDLFFDHYMKMLCHQIYLQHQSYHLGGGDYFAPILNHSKPSLAALQHYLRLFFKLPLTITYAKPSHHKIPEHLTTRLGQYCALKRTALLGRHYYQAMSAVLITIGPLDYSQYRNHSFREIESILSEVMQSYLPVDVSYHIQVSFCQLPRAVLARRHHNHATKLGRCYLGYARD